MGATNRIVARRVGAEHGPRGGARHEPLALPVSARARGSFGVRLLGDAGGRLVNGDSIDVSLSVEEGATLVAFTQASTKVFRGASRQSVVADVKGTLVFVPHAVSCFAGAKYAQSLDVRLAGEGSCIVLEAVTAGRPAYGERWAMESLELRTTITCEGRTLVRDALVLDRGILGRLAPYEALASLFAMGPMARSVGEGVLDPPVTQSTLVAAPSPLARTDGALCRIAARSPDVLFAEARRRLRNLPDIEAVLPSSLS